MKYRDIRQPNYRHVGKYSPRKEARELVTGKALFLDDFSLPHMLIGRTKRSPYPHARIVKIDTAEAEALEGVRAVITHKNAPFLAGLGWPVHRLVLEPKVFYVGDQVAIVAAETQEIANEAIDLIEVEYEQLPAVFTAADALKEGAPQLYERFPGNLVDPGCPYFQPDGPFWQVKRGDPDKAIAEADFVAEDEISFSKMPCPLAPEAPSVIVRYDGNQHYTVWASSQSSHIMKLLMQAYVPGSQIDVNTFNVGGSYGNKQTMLNAADVEGIHVDLRAGNVCLHQELHDVRALRGSPHGVVLVAVVAHDHGRRLGGQGARHLGERDLVLGDEIRFGDGLVGIAPLHLPERAVGLEIRAARVDQVARETLIQLRSAFLQGIRGRENRRKLLVLDLDQIDRLVRDLLRLGGDDRDLIAYVEDLGLEHEAMHRPAEAGQERRVLVRDDGAHAFERFGLGGIDLHDARVRIRAPLRPADQHVGKREVVEKERLAGDELPRFLARRVFADVAVVRLPDIAVFHRSFPA